MISAHLVSRIAAQPWFRASWSPYSILDSDLCIREVNPAFERATRQHRDRVIGRSAFEAFPANPAAPDDHGVAQVSRSFETVLRTGTRQWHELRRYDVPHPRQEGVFLHKVWMPVDEPVVEHGRVVGMLHHVQDVTPAADAAVRRPAVAYDPVRMAATLDLLQQQFPDEHPHLVLGVLTDSQRIVLETIHTPDIDKAAQLARLRLEIRTGQPAAPGAAS